MPSSITVRHTSRRAASRSDQRSLSDEPVEISPTSGSRSLSDSAAEDGWTDLGYSTDGIEPDDSASGYRNPHKHRLAAPAAPAPPTAQRRQHSSRNVSAREHTRLRSTSHREGQHRRRRSVQSDSVDSYEDYPAHARIRHMHPHQHHLEDHRHPHWAHVPQHAPQAGFSGSMMPNAGYQPNTFNGPIGPPQTNMMIPFAQDPYNFGPNPFMPAMSSASSGYFSHNNGYRGQEMIPYNPGEYYKPAYGPPPYGPQWTHYAPQSVAHSQTTSAPEDRYDKLERLILKQKEDQIEREKAAEAKAAKAAMDKAAAVAAAAALVDAAKKARDEAEKEATDKAKKEKEKSDKALAEAKAGEEAAKAEAEALKPKEKYAPVKFKDAVGRKFNFPFHMCNTWKGMEELIQQAFLHVDKIGPHVREGHYDLVGPNGEIILPAVWDKTIEPDWSITMLMWPVPEPPPVVEVPFPLHGHGATVKRSSSKKAGPKSSNKKAHSPPVVVVPPPPPILAGPLPPLGPMSDIMVVDVGHATAASSVYDGRSRRSAPIPPLLAWAAGGGRKGSGTSLKDVKKPEASQALDAPCCIM